MDPVIEEIRRRADIVEVIGEYVALIPAGAERWKACCPFHNEKTPSFNVSRDKGFFKCFGCGAAGDIFKFVALAENLPFGEVKRKLAERYGVPLRERAELSPEQEASYAERDRLLRVTSTAAAWFREQFAGNAGLQARDYARSRKLSRETLEAFGVGYAPDSWDACTQFLTRKFGFAAEEGAKAGLLVEKEDERGKRYYDRYRHRLIFPIWDDRGAVIAFGGRALEGGETGTPEAKYINSPEGRLFSKSRVLYAWHKAKDAVHKRQSLIVTEGYMDAIALHAAGFVNTVATLGTSLTEQHIRLSVLRTAPKKIFLCFDGDSAGVKAALRAGPMFDSFELRVYVVIFPQGHDADTYVQQFGVQGFEQLLDQAPALTQYKIQHAIGDWFSKSRVEQIDSLAEAAHVIATIKDLEVRNKYIMLLAQRLANSADARASTHLEESIRAQVRAAENELKRDSQNQRRREQERAAVQARLRESGAGGVIALPQPEGGSGQAEQDGKYLEGGLEQAEASGGEVLAFTPGRPKREWLPDAEWRARKGRGDWKRGEEDSHNSIEGSLPRAEAGGTDTVAARLLANVATGDDSGVVKAEKALLSAMLHAPSLRAGLCERLAPSMWTREAHFEIASYLKALPEEEPVDPPRLFEELSPEAGGLVGDLLLGKTMESMEPKVLDDYIKRIEAHHARRREHESLQLLLGKTQRGEPIEPGDKERFEEAARETKRLVPPEK